MSGTAGLLFTVALLTIILNVNVGRAKESVDTLQLVNVVFRHGQRTPADTYPADPHINYTFYPFGWGQLTNEGKVMQYELGKFLRARYDSFLGDVFTNDLLRVQSTDVDRTMMSAQLTSAGLFPPKGFQKWNPDLNWQPIPVHAEPLDQDSLLLVRIPCPRYYEELETVKNSEEVKEYLSSLKPLYETLSKHSGLTVKNPDDVQSIYSTLLAEIPFNLTLPEWTSTVYPKEMATVTAYSFTLNVYNDELKKLKGGPLLKKIIKDAKAKSADPGSKRKMFMYAGHDSTVANLMMALKVWDEQIPTYSIMAIIELHQVQDVYGLKIFLRNSTEHEPYQLKVPGCEDFCSLEKVEELTKSVIPEDLNAECLSHDPNYSPPPPSGP